MKTKRPLLTTVLATGALFAATNALALPFDWVDQLPAWSSTASSCSVDESAAGRYEFSLSQFRFKGNSVSGVPGPLSLAQPITVRCNVTPIYDRPASSATWISPTWNSLIVGYKDTDGIGTKAQVSASLRKVSRYTLAESTLATFNSNLSPVVTANEDVKQFNHTFDFKNNEYYVEINLYRTDTTVTTPSAYTVRLAYGYIAEVPK